MKLIIHDFQHQLDEQIFGVNKAYVLPANRLKDLCPDCLCCENDIIDTCSIMNEIAPILGSIKQCRQLIVISRLEHNHFSPEIKNVLNRIIPKILRVLKNPSFELKIFFYEIDKYEIDLDELNKQMENIKTQFKLQQSELYFMTDIEEILS